MENSKKKWINYEVNILNNETITALFNNEIACIRIKNFYSEKKTTKVINLIQSIGLDSYQYVYPPINKIGITQYEYANVDKKYYFDNVKKANEIQKPIYNVFSEVLSFIEKKTNIECSIAYEKDLQKEYFAGLIRQINQALLHIDFAPRDAEKWDISKIDSQIAWNLFLSLNKDGGETVIYNREWKKNDDELYKIKDSYGYTYEVIANCEKVVCKPNVGDLVLHNSRNYHEVMRSESINQRITMSSFCGRLESEIIFWN